MMHPDAPLPRVVERAIEILRAFGRRKPMYLATVDVPNVQGYLLGFRLGFLSARGLLDDGFWNRAIESRGWADGARDPADVMRERGLDDGAIMDELVEIEVLTLRLVAGDEPRGEG
jgi:hypothetical protein